MASEASTKILEVADIYELASAYTRLEPVGGGVFRGKTPLRAEGERSPSFFVNINSKTFKCHSTNQGGGLIEMVRLLEGYATRSQAVEYLLEKYNIKLDGKKSQQESEDARLRKQLKIANDWFLEHTNHPKSVAYCESRKLTKDIRDQYLIGFCPEEKSEEFVKHMLQHGFSISDLYNTKMIYKKIETQKYRCRFEDRIIFPVMTLSDMIVGFVGRDIHNAKSDKYINSGFQKSHYFFGYNVARKILNQNNTKLGMCEGPIDAIFNTIYANLPTVCTFGASPSDKQLKMGSTIASDLYLTFDSDSSGKSALIKAYEQLSRIDASCLVYAITIPKHKDTADFIEKEGAEEFKNLLAKAIPDTAVYVDTIYGKHREKSPNIHHAKRKTIAEIHPTYIDIAYTYRGMDLITRLAQVLDMDKASLEKWMHNETKFEHTRNNYNKMSQIEFDYSTGEPVIYERRIMTSCLNDLSYVELMKSQNISPLDFESLIVSKVFDILYKVQNPFLVAEELQEGLSKDDFEKVMHFWMLSHTEPSYNMQELLKHFIIRRNRRLGIKNTKYSLNALGKPLTTEERKMKDSLSGALDQLFKKET